jgi:hypothetical protein
MSVNQAATTPPASLKRGRSWESLPTLPKEVFSPHAPPSASHLTALNTLSGLLNISPKVPLTSSHTHTDTNIHRYTFTHIHTYTHIHTPTHTYTHTHTNTYKHTHTDTHTTRYMPAHPHRLTHTPAIQTLIPTHLWLWPSGLHCIPVPSMIICLVVVLVVVVFGVGTEARGMWVMVGVVVGCGG